MYANKDCGYEHSVPNIHRMTYCFLQQTLTFSTLQTYHHQSATRNWFRNAIVAILSMQLSAGILLFVARVLEFSTKVCLVSTAKNENRGGLSPC